VPSRPACRCSTSTTSAKAGSSGGCLRKHKTVLMPRGDRAIRKFSLWTDIQLVRRLRGRSGIPRRQRGPGPVNLLLARPARCRGLKTIGLEQMNLAAHPLVRKRSIRGHYPNLDALVVLTEQDREAYREFLGDAVPACAGSPTRCGHCPAPKADLAAKTIYAAGRFRTQKGLRPTDPRLGTGGKSAPRTGRCDLRAAAARSRAKLLALVEQHELNGSPDARRTGRGHRLRHGRGVGVRAPRRGFEGFPADPASRR